MTKADRDRIYEVMNCVIPKGNGRCRSCRPGSPCRSCQTRSDFDSICPQCDGSGIDQSGIHCVECENNHEKWAGRNNANKRNDLFDKIARQLIGRR